MRFWVGESKTGLIITAKNKKILRDKVEPNKESFKGTKIRQFEVSYTDHADLAIKLMGSNMGALVVGGYATVVSEYDA